MKKEIKKEWFLDRYCKQQFAALVENGKLAEFDYEPEPRTSCVGNIYKGQVTNVLSGMNAAFVNCGLSRNCYLSMDTTYTDYTKYDGTMVETKQETPTLKVGDEIIVQVTQAARGNKGAKVTTHLSFVGKRIIYLPNTSFLGISRKIVDEAQREKLLQAATKMRECENEGFIIRTQAPFATQKQLKTETDYLKSLYREMTEYAKTAPVGTLLYEDEDLPVRVVRDSFGESIDAFYVGDEELYERLLHLIRLRKDFPEKKLIKYTGDRLMLKEHGILDLIYDIAQPITPLDDGGYLVIEHTEAMTVIDVNTGKFIGENNLEETVFATNLSAAKEIARQVRLRNIAGIIVVDFIDMAEEDHRLAVTEELKRCLALDKTKTNVLPMSEFCITQFTRKRVGENSGSFFVKPCPHCNGIGHVHDDIYVISRLRAMLLDCFADGNTVAIVDLNINVMKKILSEGFFAVEAKTRWKDKRIYFIPHKTYKEDCFFVKGETAKILQLPDNAQLLQ